LQEGHIQPAIDKFMLVAELYTLRGETTQAIRLFNRIIEFAPMDLSVRSHLIDLLTAQGKTEEAVQQYQNLADIYYQLAELDMARQTYTTALKLTQQSRSSRPVMIQILYKIADIDMQRLDLRNAMRIYEQIRTLEPEDVHGRARLVELNFRIGQESAAFNEIDGFLGLLENSSKRERAIEFLKEVIADEPEKREVRKRLADIYRRTGKLDDALQQWEMLLNQALAHTDKPQVIEALQAIVTLNPPNIEDYQKRLAQIQRMG
jgi:tetratricopeptide (TPR) repeat protein